MQLRRVSKKRLTDDQEQVLVLAYASGKSLKQVGAVFDVDGGTARNVLLRHGVVLRPRITPSLTLEQEQEICRRYEAGESSRDLAAAFDVSVQTICNTLKRQDVQARPAVGHKGSGRARTFNDEQEREIGRRYIAGESTVDLSTAFAVSKGTIGNILVRLDVQVRTDVGGSKLKLSDDQEKEVTQRYLDGETVQTLSQVFDVAIRTIYNVLDRRGIGRRADAPTGVRALSDLEELAIVQRYHAGEVANVIAKDYPQVNRQTVYNVVERRGGHEPKSPLDDLARAQVVALCQDGSKIREVAEVSGVSESTVARILREYREDGGIVDMPIGKPRIYDVNEAAFDVLSEAGEYWAGFLWADGCIHENRLICILGEKDREHLFKLRSFIGSTHPVREIPKSKTSLGGPFAGYSVHSKKLCEALVSRGFVKKRARTPAPELANSPHFWRGEVDGDGALGSVLVDRVNRMYSYIELCGQAILVDAFRSFLTKNGLADLPPHPTKSGIWRVTTFIDKNIAEADAIIKLLYENNTIALTRKNDRAQAIISGNITKFSPYVECESRQNVPDEVVNLLIENE